MSTVGVKELKNKLTQYLRRAKQGEKFIVTERGNPVAVLQPIRAARGAQSLDARLASLAARGLVTLPTRKRPARVRPVRVRGKAVSRIILEDRR